jgi:hypothetical protein
MRTITRRLTVMSSVLAALLACAQNADSNVPEHLIPDTPDGTVLAVAKGLQDNHPEILWSALPESYRQDITDITHAFAEKMDPVIYDRAFALVIRALEVLDDRKDIILASETFKSSGADPEEFRQGLSNSQVFTETLKSSEIATLQGLASVDWQQFLATTGAQMIEHASANESAGAENPLDDLESLEVETLEVNGDRAKLRIASKNHEPEEVEMVRVEGRWVPAEMADEWPQFVEDARQSLADITPENMAEQKTQIMMLLGMADGLIEQIASLQTPEEFDAAIGSMLAPFMGGTTMETSEDTPPEALEEEREEE